MAVNQQNPKALAMSQKAKLCEPATKENRCLCALKMGSGGRGEASSTSTATAGKGVNQDFVKAYFWVTLAAKQHERDAEKQRSKLAPKLSPDDVTTTEQSASVWKPRSGQPPNPATVH